MPEPGGEGEEPQPDAGAQARECAGAWRLRPSCPLQVQKTDSIHWRTRPSDPNWSGSSLRSALGEEVVDQHVSCREKVVELGVHRSLRVDGALATHNFGGLRVASLH